MSLIKISDSNLNKKRLTRRYLIWCYKTTKESLDRIDRYFTQLEVDQFILQQLNNQLKQKSKSATQEYKQLINEFEAYMLAKRENVLKQKFLDARHQQLQPPYQYLQQRFKAIEKAIVTFLGKAELKKIADLYEGEMTTRIMQAREH